MKNSIRNRMSKHVKKILNVDKKLGKMKEKKHNLEVKFIKCVDTSGKVRLIDQITILEKEIEEYMGKK